MMHSMLFFFILLFVQVVVESLPVSSSAHVQLVQKYLHARLDMSGCVLACVEVGKKMMDFDTLLHLMHLPTLLIILFYFRDRLFFLCRSLHRSWLIIGKIIGLTAIADCITVLFYIFFKLFPPAFPLGIGFCITAGLLYFFCLVDGRGAVVLGLSKDRPRNASIDSARTGRYAVSHTVWNWRYALVLGTVQGIALLPGISRFAAVYVCACWLGLPQRKAFEITWLVQVPLVFAACAQSIYLLWKADQLMPLLNFCTLWMTIIATICGLSAFYLAAYLAREGKLWWFSFYMIVPMVAWLYLCLL
jgi:undecaprenyl-diphosphatase